MNSMTRREAARLLAAGAGSVVALRQDAAAKIDSVIRGVQIGAQSYSFRDRDLDACIEAYRTVGLGLCELWNGHIEPRNLKREALRKWHAEASPEVFRAARRKLDRAGIQLFAWYYGFTKDMSDEEIERGFKEAEALGVKVITSSANISVVPRVDRYAQKHKIVVGMHNHDQTHMPDEFSSAETFERGLQQTSRYIQANLDIGHFVAAGSDPLEFTRKHHDRIAVIHIKDRKRNHGENLPFGQGETPIGAVLRLLRDNKWRIPANIEYEYGKPGYDAVAEVKKSFEFCRRELEQDVRA